MVKKSAGFTLVELLIVVVVIAILAAISIVAYNGIRDREQDTAVQADLSTSHKKLVMYFQEYGTYPTANECPVVSSTAVCLPSQPNVSLMYTPNNSASPPSYLLVANAGTKTYSVSSSSGPSQGISGKIPVSVTNLVTNGDFSGGLSGWTTNCAMPAACYSVSNGAAVAVADPASSRTMLYQAINTSYTDKDKLYYSIKVKRNGGTGFSADVSRTSGGYPKDILTTAQFSSLSTGSFQRFSTVRDFDVTQGAYTTIFLGRYTSGNNFSVELDDAIAINLTRNFGAGNEPSASTMDVILQQQVPNQYFSGTTTIYK
jgi:general secretion pathway protein G